VNVFAGLGTLCNTSTGTTAISPWIQHSLNNASPVEDENPIEETDLISMEMLQRVLGKPPRTRFQESIAVFSELEILYFEPSMALYVFQNKT